MYLSILKKIIVAYRHQAEFRRYVRKVGFDERVKIFRIRSGCLEPLSESPGNSCCIVHCASDFFSFKRYLGLRNIQGHGRRGSQA